MLFFVKRSLIGKTGSATSILIGFLDHLKNRSEYIEDYQERKEGSMNLALLIRGDYPYVSENSGLRSTYESYEDHLKACAEAEI